MGLTEYLPLAALNFQTLPDQVVNGLLLGAIYALMALGYTMVYGILRLINFAHGEVYMLGAYIALFASYILGYGPGATIGADPTPIIAAQTVFIAGIGMLVVGAILAIAGTKVASLPVVVKAVGFALAIIGLLAVLVGKFQPQALNADCQHDDLRYRRRPH